MNLRIRFALSFARGSLRASLVFASAIPAVSPLSAQSSSPEPAASRSSQATGAISGRVQNEATNQYLNNARVTVKGTDISALTDEFGSFRLNVPSGPVVLEVLYSGLDPQQVTVTVPAGQMVEQNIGLTNRARYGEKSDVVKLDPFIAQSSKLTEGESLATNEQRFASNIKNVVATDAFGDVTEGNVAEFMKFLPGISVEYSDVMPLAVAVRGFDPSMTNVTTDGASLANASRGATTRQFDFMQVSINNVSRIEVTKVPTPANPASGISGSVNMVSKSAFERSRAQFNYRVFASASSDGMQIKKQPFPFDTYERRINPGFDFDYTLPLSKNFGIVVTALSSKAWNEQNISATTWNGRDAGATPSRPYLQSHNIVDAPKWYYRNSAGLKADWRVTRNSVLSLGLQATYYQDVNGNVSRAANVGTNPAPTPATGVRMEYGEDFAHSATGRGTVTMGGNFLRIDARTLGTNLRYRFENGDWRIDTTGFASNSKTWLRSYEKGYFNSLGIALLNPTGNRVNFDSIRPERPGTIRAFDAANREIDILDIRNFRLNTATTGGYRDHRDDTFGGELNVKRRLKLFEIPAAVQVGGSYKSQDRDHRRYTRVFTYNPPNPADPTPAPFLAQIYKNRPNYFSFDNIPWVSANNAVTAWGQNPNLFTQTPAQMVTEEQTRIVGMEHFKETTKALYAQTEVRLFRNRLTALTGVRYEKVHDKAAGPLFDPAAVWVRTESGAFARNAAGQRIRKTEAGAVGSMEELRLIRTALGNRVNRSDDGYYPSLHLTFNATEKLLVRAAYARTYGPPNFNNLIPNTTINENDIDEEAADPSVIRGTITIRNPNLKPWTAHNYDLSAEYYTDNGGVISAGVFRKDITDFFGNAVTFATAADVVDFGLDERYVGWNVSTTFNSGDARVTGMEFNVRQSLAPFGKYGRFFSVFANATKLRLEGSQTASFSAFIPKVVNWGATFTKNPVTLMLKWHHRGEQKGAAQPVLGPDAFQYRDARTTMDVNLTYQVWRRHSLFVNGRNVFNQHYNISRYGSETPDYAKRSSTNSYGVQWAFGLKGTF
ncbi:MAG: TonB-dependent receptor [Opitutaceae bacterium]|nr:TonB-dependent receptor [Opitutaceae bacterium]